LINREREERSSAVTFPGANLVLLIGLIAVWRPLRRKKKEGHKNEKNKEKLSDTRRAATSNRAHPPRQKYQRERDLGLVLRKRYTLSWGGEKIGKRKEAGKIV